MQVACCKALLEYFSSTESFPCQALSFICHGKQLPGSGDPGGTPTQLGGRAAALCEGHLPQVHHNRTQGLQGLQGCLLVPIVAGVSFLAAVDDE